MQKASQYFIQVLKNQIIQMHSFLLTLDKLVTKTMGSFSATTTNPTKEYTQMETKS